MNATTIVCTDTVTIAIILVVAIILGIIIGYYFRMVQESRKADKVSEVREVRYVNLEQLEKMHKAGGLIKFPTSAGAIVSCPFCKFENVAVFDLENDKCQECFRPLKGGDVFLGLRAHTEVWLKGKGN